MERYALLSGQQYYPAPGWMGFDSWHAELETAVQKGEQIKNEGYTWYQVLDTYNFKIVAGAGKAHTGLFGNVDCAVK